MCEQLRVLEKIRKEGKVNGFATELAEAQAKDYVSMLRRLDAMEIEQQRQGTEQARQGGMIEAIFSHIHSPIEQERQAGMVWLELRKFLSSWKGWAIIVFFLMAVALAGEKIMQLTGWLPTGV